MGRGLGDERRTRIVRELDSAQAPLDASELARRVGLHANTVRFHLALLTEAGLVRSHAAPRRTPGRPRILYELTASGRAGSGDEYRLLATVLTQVAARTPDGVAACEEAGRAWGRELVAAAGEGDDVAAVVELLAVQGFQPSANGRTIGMRRCPFHDLAETSPEVVCGLHRGLIDGALAARGSDLAVAELDVFPTPGVCFARLAALPRGRP